MCKGMRLMSGTLAQLRRKLLANEPDPIATKESLLCPNHLDPHTTTQIGFDWAAATNQPWIPLEGKRASWYQGCDDWIFVQGFQ